jgi:raffinose/stachyose/melibiose transport system permease protein
VTGVGRRAPARRRRSHSPEFWGWMLNLPALAVFGTFFLGPAAVGLWFSLHEWDGVSRSAAFVGLSNYATLLTTERFWGAFRVNMLVAVLSLAMQMPLALGLALALSRRGRLVRVYRSAIFAPQVLSVAAVALTWNLVYDPSQGLLNRLLDAMGLGPVEVAWLGDPRFALVSVLAATTWFYFGLHMLLFMAGLAAIPPEYLDVARIETTRWHQRLRHVTLPLLREQLLISFTLIVSGSFGHLLGLFFLMTDGGPAGRTELLGLYMTKVAFRGGQYGLGSAVSVVLLVLVLVIVIWPILRVGRERLEFGL